MFFVSCHCSDSASKCCSHCSCLCTRARRCKLTFPVEERHLTLTFACWDICLFINLWVDMLCSLSRVMLRVCLSVCACAQLHIHVKCCSFCVLIHTWFLTATFQCSTLVANTPPPTPNLLKLTLIQSAILCLSAPPSSLNLSHKHSYLRDEQTHKYYSTTCNYIRLLSHYSLFIISNLCKTP